MSARCLLPAALLLLAACSDSNDPDDPSAGLLADPEAPGVASASGDPDASYLLDDAARDGVTVTASGLQYEVLREADGPTPGPTAQVTLHYRGTLVDGTEFDSSYSRGAPSTFALDGTIPGFAEGVQLMSPGAQYRFVLPADLAYGDAGSPPSIGPGATLIFVVELLEINSG